MSFTSGRHCLGCHMSLKNCRCDKEEDMSKQNPTVEDDIQYKALEKRLELTQNQVEYYKRKCFGKPEDSEEYKELLNQLDKANKLLTTLHYGPVNTYTWKELKEWVENEGL